MVFGFLKNLVRQKSNEVQAKARSKAMGVRANAQMKASNTIRAQSSKAAKKVTKRKKGEAQAVATEGSKDEKMKFFRRRRAAAPAPAQEPDASFGEKTQFIQAFQEEEFKPVVGWLVALNGPDKGHDFRIRDGKNVIGTAADVDVVVTDQYMSSRHAVIRHEDGIFVIVDLDSTNGTYVNEQRCSKEEIIDNDTIRFGRTSLKFKSLY